MSIEADAKAMADDLIALRRRLHRSPEVGLDLPRTQEQVLGALDGLPLEISTGTGLSSVTAVLRGGRDGRPGPAVLLRGDMDALPVTEQTGEPFASEIDGAMHACGHDLHVAGLVGAARLLAARRDRLAGDVVFMFQPGEEGLDGAGHMIREGVLTAAGRPVAAGYGLHVMSTYPLGVFSGRPGPLMAASSGLFVTVVGKGGHGSAPHLAADPVTAACEMVTALQTMVTRRFNVFDPVVVTVGSFHAGTKRNVIPDTATFDATIRTFSAESHDRISSTAQEICTGIAAAHGVGVEVEFVDEYPVTVNNAAEHEFLAGTVRDVFGMARFQPLDFPITGSEDFSRVLDEVPGAYVFLGASRAAEPETAPYNHSPLATFDDGVLPDGATLLAELAIRKLDALAESAESPVP